MKNKYISFLTLLLVVTELLSAQENSITIKEFAAILNTSKNAQILDARSPEEFAVNHIKGAINVDLKDAAGSEKIISSLNPKYPTFSYSINNGRSSALAKKLREKGFEKVYELPGGLGNWVGAGYPLLSFYNKGLAISSKQYQELIQSKELVLVDVGSKYCGGCRKLVPVLDSLDNYRASNLRIVRIEFDNNPELVKEQEIKALPTLKLYKNGQEVWFNKGHIVYQQLLSIIQQKGNLLTIK
jgi:rhodanese-related sulfurtransferase